MSRTKAIEMKYWSHTCHGRWMSEDYQSGLVSIVVPTFNRAQFLGESLDSILAQTYRPIEVLVVDDGSTDNTAATVAERQKRCEESDLTIQYLPQVNRGAPAARNLGLIESRGEFIQFLDSDDLLLPEKCERAVQSLRNSKYDFVYCLAQLVDEHLVPLGKTSGRAPHQDETDALMRTWYTHAPLYRREVVRTAGPWIEELAYHQDWEFGVRVKLLGYQGVFDSRADTLARLHTQDRICTLKNIYKKIASVELSYDAAQDLATKTGRMTSRIRKVLVEHYIRAAVQYAREGYEPDKIRCFHKAHKLSGTFSVSGKIAWLLARINLNKSIYRMGSEWRRWILGRA